jgi:hypothetical protein
VAGAAAQPRKARFPARSAGNAPKLKNICDVNCPRRNSLCLQFVYKSLYLTVFKKLQELQRGLLIGRFFSAGESRAMLIKTHCTGLILMEKIMKKLLVAFGLGLCARFTVFAEEGEFFVGGALGACFNGNVEVGELQPGVEDIRVRNIDMESGGSVAGFTIEAFAGYKITSSWSADLTLALGISGSAVDSGYTEKESFYTSSGPGRTVTAYDHLEWGGFFSFDAGASYRFFADLDSIFIINGKFSVGMFGSLHGGLRYAAIDGWKGGKSPGAEYKATSLVEPVEGFFFKSGFDIGIGGKIQGLINVHAKIFPASFSAEREAVINDGINRRKVRFGWRVKRVVYQRIL